MRAPFLNDGDVRLYLGDCVEVMRIFPDRSVQTCVTSPPYWGLRDYGIKGQIGLEETPDGYVERLVAVFREVKRVLRDDGTLWLNLGDSYTGSAISGGANQNAGGPAVRVTGVPANVGIGLKPKDLVGIPWRVAFALQADGWYLRSDIIWAKPNPMPESVTDRPTKAHEYVFLLSKSARYFYDVDAIAERASFPEGNGNSAEDKYVSKGLSGDRRFSTKAGLHLLGPRETRNARSVWTISTKPYPDAHFATFPPELPERCIKAGSREGDTVLDPFIGSGTTALVARQLGRNAVGIDLSAEYLTLAAKRLQQLSLLTVPA